MYWMDLKLTTSILVILLLSVCQCEGKWRRRYRGGRHPLISSSSDSSSDGTGYSTDVRSGRSFRFARWSSSSSSSSSLPRRQETPKPITPFSPVRSSTSLGVVMEEVVEEIIESVTGIDADAEVAIGQNPEFKRAFKLELAHQKRGLGPGYEVYNHDEEGDVGLWMDKTSSSSSSSSSASFTYIPPVTPYQPYEEIIASSSSSSSSSSSITDEPGLQIDLSNSVHEDAHLAH